MERRLSPLALTTIITIAAFNFHVIKGLSTTSISSTVDIESDTNTTSALFTENPFAGGGGNLVWLEDALKEVAYYLRSHKFNDYDRRYETDAERAPREYHARFPVPALRSLHWEVRRYCEPSFVGCAEYLWKRARRAGIKRAEDAAVVAQERNWTEGGHEREIEAVEEDCRRRFEVDFRVADPFQGPIERFQWRVTASYYMCWYTMNGVTDLTRLNDYCDNRASCLDPEYGAKNWDPRAKDQNPFACALYSFCPDPCCPMKHLYHVADCWDDYENPCYEYNPPGRRVCLLNRTQNTDFRDLVLNRFNITCACTHDGYVWSTLFGLCIDVDECAVGDHGCDPETEACINLPGSFKCACRWGYKRLRRGKCEPSPGVALVAKKGAENALGKKGEGTKSVMKMLAGMFRKSEAPGLIHVDVAVATAAFLCDCRLNRWIG